MKTFKLYLILSLLLLGTSSFSQIFQTKSAIINELGDDYESGVADDGTNYIAYKKEFKTEASGTYTRIKVIYFVQIEDEEEICNMWKVIEPSSETNSTVAYLKKKYVEVDYMQWKDYENEILYDVDVEDGRCITWAWYDTKK